MPEWQYRALDLNDLPRKSEALDLLNDAGAGGWELVIIMPNHIAYLKRQVAKQRAKSATTALRPSLKKSPK
jgi:hypothetical protein